MRIEQVGKGRVDTVITSGTLVATIVLAMTLGIGAGYSAILGILWVFGHRNRVKAPAGLPSTVVSGD
jgi:hypothetical protein